MERPVGPSLWYKFTLTLPSLSLADFLTIGTWIAEDCAKPVAQRTTDAPGFLAFAQFAQEAVRRLSVPDDYQPPRFAADALAREVAEVLSEPDPRELPGRALAAEQSLAACAQSWLRNEGPKTEQDLPELQSRADALALVRLVQSKFNDHPVTLYELAWAATDKLADFLAQDAAAPLGSQHLNAELQQQLADALRAKAIAENESRNATSASVNKDATVQAALHSRLVAEQRRDVALEAEKAAREEIQRLKRELEQAKQDLKIQQEADLIDAQLALQDPVLFPHLWKDQ